MQKPIPKLTKDLGLDFWWDTQKLWEVDLPIEEMKLQEFEWMLDKARVPGGPPYERSVERVSFLTASLCWIHRKAFSFLLQ